MRVVRPAGHLPESRSGVMPRARRSGHPIAAWVLVIAFPACAPVTDPRGTLHTDSAGVAIATAVTPLWGPGEGWRVAADPLVEIGTVTGAPEYQLADVVAAVRLSTGDIVIADRGSLELRRYDGNGVFGAELHSGGAPPDKAVGVVGHRLVIRLLDFSGDIPEGIVRWPGERLVTLDPGDGTVTPLLDLPGPEANVTRREGGGYRHGRYAFGNMPEYGAAVGRIAVIDTEAYTVRIISPDDGSLGRVIRRDVVPRAATGALFEAHLDGIAAIAFPDPENVPPEDLDGLRQMWRGFPRAPTLPVLRSVHVDGAGNLWVAQFYLAGAGPTPFEVFAPDGVWLGSVELPPGLDRGFIQYQAPCMEIGADYLLGVWKDDLDVPYVRIYRLHK